MGFFVMVFSMIIGIALLVTGIVIRKSNKMWIASVTCGIVFIILSIWLGLPK